MGERYLDSEKYKYKLRFISEEIQAESITKQTHITKRDNYEKVCHKQA